MSIGTNHCLPVTRITHIALRYGNIVVSISTLHILTRQVLTYNNTKLKCACLNVLIIATPALIINELSVVTGHCFNN